MSSTAPPVPLLLADEDADALLVAEPPPLLAPVLASAPVLAPVLVPVLALAPPPPASPVLAS